MASKYLDKRMKSENKKFKNLFKKLLHLLYILL